MGASAVSSSTTSSAATVADGGVIDEDVAACVAAGCRRLATEPMTMIAKMATASAAAIHNVRREMPRGANAASEAAICPSVPSSPGLRWSRRRFDVGAEGFVLSSSATRDTRVTLSGAMRPSSMSCRVERLESRRSPQNRFTIAPTSRVGAGKHAASSASMNSDAVWYRAARSRASDLITTASTPRGTAGARTEGKGTGSSAMRRIVSNSLSPRKRRDPVRVSQSTTPALKRSARRSTCWAYACSGDM